MTSTLQGQAELRRNESQPILDRPDKLNDPSFLLTLHRWASPTRNRAGSTTPNGPVGLGLTRSPHDPFILITLNQLGTVYHAANKPAAAKTVFQRSLSAAETAPYKDQSKLAQAETLGQRAGQMTEAVTLRHAAFTTLQATLEDRHLEILNELHDLGLVHGYSGNPVRAEEICRQALQGFEQSPLGADHHRKTSYKVTNQKKEREHDVAVCDFSSMYPTIMMGANISPDSILPPIESLRTEGAVTWDECSVSAVCNGRAARFRDGIRGVVPESLRKLVEERKKHKANRPTRAMALKVGANSIYGSFGYEMSALYSPSCSAATTAFGRWCLALSICMFEKCGLKVLYGDTDSCFLSSTRVTAQKYHGSLRDHCNAALRILKNVLSFTPFKDMDMCLEGLHKRMLLLEKKNYAYISSTGEARYKGISVARKDALGICRKVSKCTVDMILYGGNSPATKSAIALMCATALDACSLSSLTLMDVSKVVRAEGGSCYRYVDFNGDKIDVKIEDASPASTVSYGKAEIAARVSKEVTRYTSAAGLGTVYDIMWSCPVFDSLGYPIH
ncbi:hypothetical protein ETB97_009808 [Aspergillus alliaceus]|uniref:DNA-directed DNA polymerase n=1 Tax=Petromyces alliaceus TaxID=209559 RepID=A0A8H6E8M3_PETAA|nr:hypothetical protein ETB97_009808 [Aspergillus burnettii]